MYRISVILREIIIPAISIFALLLILTLIFNRVIYNVRKFRARVAKAKIDIFLTQLVFSQLDDNAYKAAINQFKKRIPYRQKWCKQIILHEIIGLNQNLKGEVTKSIHLLYEQFNLLKLSLRYLRNPIWYIKSTGIYHFQALEYTEAAPMVRPYLTSDNTKLSSNAYMAMVSLAPQSLDLLSRFRNPISLTNEIKIMDLLHTNKTPMPTNLKDWIHASNPSIVKLGLQLMVFYNYNNESAAVIGLLQHENRSIRKEAVKTIRDLFLMPAEKPLIERFFKEGKSVQIEILKTLSVIGTKESEHFMTGLLSTEIFPDTKLQALYAINAINPELLDNLETYNPEITKMIQHVKDPNI